MTKLRVAVIGAGHLGRIHARLVRTLPHVELTAVVDPIVATRHSVASDNDTRAIATTAEIIDEIDAAIVAAPNSEHHAIGQQLLGRGVHVLMEKPICMNSTDAGELVETAKANDCVLQVGHVERFNPALQAAKPLLVEPKYIEARRLGSFTFRSLDVGVVLDLMIHDLDVILDLVGSRVTNVVALGTAILTDHEDMAQARLEFENGCVANLVASRVAVHAERKMSVYCPSAFAGIDFADRTATVIEPTPAILDRSFHAQSILPTERASFGGELFDSLLTHRKLESAESNPLLEEQRDFVTAIREQRQPLVGGQHGLDAVALAERICQAIESHCWNGTASGPRGPHALPGPTILPAPTLGVAQPGEQRKAG